MMTKFVDHHLLTLYATVNASLELLHTQPETDVIIELRNLLEASFDIIDCMNNFRHYGSDSLDIVIRDCDKILMQIQEMEENEHKKFD